VATVAAVSAVVGARRSCRATTKIRFRTSQALAEIVRGGGSGSTRHHYITLEHTHPHIHSHSIYYIYICVQGELRPYIYIYTRDIKSYMVGKTLHGPLCMTVCVCNIHCVYIYYGPPDDGGGRLDFYCTAAAATRCIIFDILYIYIYSML